MRKSLFHFAGLVAVVLTAGVLARPATAGPDLTALADRVFGIVNQQRAARGLSPLTRVSPLDRSAQDYAGRMATEDFFAHISPDGGTPAGRILAAGYSWSGWGENIAAGLDTAEAVMDAWMHSPGHAANILSADYSQIGIGVAVGGTYGIYWVEDFGTPLGAVPGPWTPRLNRLSATTAVAGDLLTLDGADFGSPGGVSFNGVPAYVETWSTSRVSVRVPMGGGGPVVLTSAYGSSNGLAFSGNATAPTPPPPAPPTSTPTPAPTPPASTPPPPTSTPAPPSPTSPPSSPTPPSEPPARSPTPDLPTPSPIATPTPGVPVTPRPTPPTTLTPAPTPPSVSSPPPVSTTPGPPAVTPVASPPTPTSSPAPAPLSAELRYDYLLPNRGPSGTTVHVVGTGFGPAAGQVKISAGTVTILAWSDTEIVIRVEGPKPGRKGLRIIRTDGRQSAIMPFRLTY